MPVLSGRAACNSQYAGALPATGSLGKSRPPDPCAWRSGRVSQAQARFWQDGYVGLPQISLFVTALLPLISVYNERGSIRLKSRKGCPGRSRAFSLRIVYISDSKTQ